jgi:hypothetical protein
MPGAPPVDVDANRETLRRLRDAEPVLEDIRPAGEVLPGMAPNSILTSGPALAGSYTASGLRRPHRRFRNVGYCNFYEGTNPRRLNYSATAG